MKNDKELLEKLLENIDKLTTGLCNLTLKIFPDLSEANRVLHIINKNKPTYISKENRLWWWKSGHKEPRIEFLKVILRHYA